VTEMQVSRRSFVEKALYATGIVSASTIVGSAYVAMSGSQKPASAVSGNDGMDMAGDAPSVFVPAKPVTTQEVSRHPIAMPNTTDYTLYDNGQYQKVVQRSGPITQEVHFHLSEVTAEVVPGATMDYWTFDGGEPGPMVRARVGDTIDFFLHNPKESAFPHNVDFHAITGPGGGAARLGTAPGDVSEFKGKLLNPGIFIYHCAFPDIPMHISHGMYGLIPAGGATGVEFKVDYPGDYTIVDHAIFRLHKGIAGALHVEGAEDPAIFQSVKYSTQLGAGGH
jgi:hypothetical protein